MSSPRSVLLGDIAIQYGLVGGPFGSSLVGSDYVGEGVPVIRGANLKYGRELGGDYPFVTESKFARDLARNVAEPGDIVFTQRGTLGQVALVPLGCYPKYVVSQSQMRLRVDPAIASPQFVYYACSTARFRRQVSDNAITTGVPHINLGILSKLEIPLPPLSEQRAIAEVLSALDEKIATNSTLAKTSHELSDAEFLAAVRGATLSKSTFADIATVRGGGTPASGVGDYWDGDINWATPTDVTNLPGPYLETTARRITVSGLDSCASPLYPSGSILMTSRATIGSFAVAQEPTAVNQGFIVVNPHDSGLRWWVYHEMRSRVDEFVSLANGATFLELSRGNFRKFRVRMAKDSVMEQFSAKADGLHSYAREVLVENKVLAATRDALLPQLMSGKTRVKDAEKTVEEVL